MMKAKISEIFESIQGEGIYLGERQVFVRFFGCNLQCSFCDTSLADFKEYGVDDLKSEILKFKGFQTVSLTGGEPLCQAEFLETFLASCAGSSLRFYLETNGTLPSELKRIVDRVDIIAMDFKLTSSTGGREYWKEHELFLKTAIKKDVFVKMVITQNTTGQDILASADIISRTRPDISVVLQPDGLQWSELLEKMTFFKDILVCRGMHDVKMVPQAHKLVGIK
jgi:7-carboxy-7-deazaguanine synthase